MILSSSHTEVMVAHNHHHLLSWLMTALNGLEQVLDHRVVKRGRQRKVKYLIHWEGYGDEHNTWETSGNLVSSLGCVQDYWLNLPPDQRLAAAAVLLPMPQQAGSLSPTATSQLRLSDEVDTEKGKQKRRNQE